MKCTFGPSLSSRIERYRREARTAYTKHEFKIVYERVNAREYSLVYLSAFYRVVRSLKRPKREVKDTKKRVIAISKTGTIIQHSPPSHTHKHCFKSRFCLFFRSRCDRVWEVDVISRFRDEDAYSASRRCHNRFSFFLNQTFLRASWTNRCALCVCARVCVCVCWWFFFYLFSSLASLLYSICVSCICAFLLSLKACKNPWKNLNIAYKHYVRYHVLGTSCTIATVGETVHKSLSEELAAMNSKWVFFLLLLLFLIHSLMRTEQRQKCCQWECSFEMSWFQSDTYDWMHISRPNDVLNLSIRVFFCMR